MWLQKPYRHASKLRHSRARSSRYSVCMSKMCLLPPGLKKTIDPCQCQMHSMDSARLLRIRDKLAKYNFRVSWEPGKTNINTDLLSRAPIFDPEDEEPATSTTIQCLAASMTLDTLLQHKCSKYDLLRANIQNTNKPIKNKHTAPYIKIWDKLCRRQ